MRLKENSSSWRAGGILKRDAQHGGAVPQSSHGRKKQTAKWCKGVIGRNHDYNLADIGVYGWWPPEGCSVTLQYDCVNCGRQELVWQRYDQNGEFQT